MNEKKPSCYFSQIINREGCTGYDRILVGSPECEKCEYYIKGADNEIQESESVRYKCKSKK